MTQVLKQCGNDLSRENIMKQAANLKDFELPLLLPGIKVNTSPTDFAPIEQEQLAKFDGERWVLFGEIFDALPEVAGRPARQDRRGSPPPVVCCPEDLRLLALDGGRDRRRERTDEKPPEPELPVGRAARRAPQPIGPEAWRLRAGVRRSAIGLRRGR